VQAYLEHIYRPQELSILFVDDNNENAMSVGTYQSEVRTNPSTSFTILGSGKPSIKKKMLSEIKGRVFYIKHPKATILTDSIGDGSVIAPGAVVSTKVDIGEHVLINYNATIGHDTIVGNLSVVSPNAAVGGWCVVGRESYIGAGAQIREKTVIGNNVMVGMGAVVVKDIPDNHIAVGNPARFVHVDQWKEKNNGMLRI
jgi:sugar O-acyltransferase (sialic acid O-acetyltransferase NeuD family)